MVQVYGVKMSISKHKKTGLTITAHGGAGAGARELDLLFPFHYFVSSIFF